MSTRTNPVHAGVSCTLACALISLAGPASAGDPRELPAYRIPNLPESGEAYVGQNWVPGVRHL